MRIKLGHHFRIATDSTELEREYIDVALRSRFLVRQFWKSASTCYRQSGMQNRSHFLGRMPAWHPWHRNGPIEIAPTAFGSFISEPQNCDRGRLIVAADRERGSRNERYPTTTERLNSSLGSLQYRAMNISQSRVHSPVVSSEKRVYRVRRLGFL